MPEERLQMICYNFNSSTTHQPKICSLGGADKSGTRVGHLNAILAQGREFERSNFQTFKCPGGGGGSARGGEMLKFRIDRRVTILRAIIRAKTATFSFAFHHRLVRLMASLCPTFEIPFNLVATWVFSSSLKCVGLCCSPLASL